MNFVNVFFETQDHYSLPNLVIFSVLRCKNLRKASTKVVRIILTVFLFICSVSIIENKHE